MTKWKDLNINDKIFYVILNKDNIDILLNNEMIIKEKQIISITDTDKNMLFNINDFGDIEMTYDEFSNDGYISSCSDDSIIILSCDHEGVIIELEKFLIDLEK